MNNCIKRFAVRKLRPRAKYCLCVLGLFFGLAFLQGGVLNTENLISKVRNYGTITELAKGSLSVQRLLNENVIRLDDTDDIADKTKYVIKDQKENNDEERVKINTKSGNEDSMNKNIETNISIDNHPTQQTECAKETNSRIIEYFKRLNKTVNTINSPVLLSPTRVCRIDDKDPYLLIMIPTTGRDLVERETIRDTWTSFRNKANNTLSTEYMDGMTIGLMFIIATKTSSPSDVKDLHEESESKGDILLLDIEETYENLIYKVFAGMRWVGEHCRDTQYLLKADMDVYVHLPNLAPLLQKHENANLVIGNVHSHSMVFRTGRWALTFDEYKFCNYLPYTEGNSYVISAKLLPNLLKAMQYIPIFKNEDAYITGILGAVIGVDPTHSSRFSKFKPTLEFPERFFDQTMISETRCSVEKMKQLWNIYLKRIGHIPV